MKKTILVSLFFIFMIGAPSALAQGFVPLAPVPGLTQGVTANTAGLAAFFNNLYKFLIGLSAAIAVIMVIWEGLRIATNQDNVSILIDSKGKIYNAIFGLILVLSPALVFSIINPNILNLSLNLEPLKTLSTTSSPNSPPISGPGIPPAGGKSATRVSGWWCYELTVGGYWCAANEDSCSNHLVGGAVQSGGRPDPEAKPDTSCTKSAGPVASACSVSGIDGLLQVAICASSDDAKTWGQSCMGALFVGNKKDSNTGKVFNFATCSGQQNYVFINTESSSIFIPNALRPLVSTAANPNNGSHAQRFASICASANLGLQTCVSDAPRASFPVPCNLTGPNAATTWKCYDEKLTCRDAFATNTYCASNPPWTPYQ